MTRDDSPDGRGGPRPGADGPADPSGPAGRGHEDPPAARRGPGREGAAEGGHARKGGTPDPSGEAAAQGGHARGGGTPDPSGHAGGSSAAGGAGDWQGIEIEVEVPLGERPLSVRLHTRSRAVAIVGPSGAGKSTLLRVLAGVESRARGRLTVDGDAWLDPQRGTLVPSWLRRVGWVPQDVHLFPHLSVRQNLAYAGATPGRVSEVAGILEVAPLLDRRPRRLSGGERQRVALGRALLSDPRLLLLDEPFSALDRPLRARLSRTVRDLAEARGIPLVLVSHDEEDAAVLAEERWHLVEGELRRG